MHQPHQGIKPQEYGNIEHESQQPNEYKGDKAAAMKPGEILRTIINGKCRPTAHAKSQLYRVEKDHQGIGCSHRSQSTDSQKVSDNKCICQVVDLLKKIA